MTGSDLMGLLMVEAAMRQNVCLPDVPEPGPGKDIDEKVTQKIGFWRMLREGTRTNKQIITQAKVVTNSEKYQAR